MVVVAHDDDDAAMAGTLAMLNAAGWEIKQICLPSGTPERDSALRKAAAFILDKVEYISMQPDERRPNMDSTTIPYAPIEREKLKGTFKYNELATMVMQKINEFKPSVIFSLDNIIGGYGHPEHVLISQMLVDSFSTGAIEARYIYQSVYPNSMEQTILRERFAQLMKKWEFPNSYETVTEMYKVEGMPAPDVQVKITSQAKAKMNFLRSFEERERKTIGFYVPHFQDFEAEEYFSVFDREFFRVIKRDSVYTK
jgi:LmbE family N-acetylglucosaminyl deacetylase